MNIGFQAAASGTRTSICRGKEKKYMIPTAALADGLEFQEVRYNEENLNNAQRPCEVEKTV